MQLERFNGFVQEINSDQELKKEISELKVYRYFDRKWFDENGIMMTDKALRADLAKARKCKSPTRNLSSSTSYFQVPSLDAVISGKIPSPTTKTRVKKCTVSISECLKHSNNAFNATHDNLTGLLNRAGFEAKLSTVANVVNLTPSLDQDSLEKIESTHAVSLLTIDIDHFKQVNDSYGHLYGDMVLQCFARRVQKAATSMQELYGGRAKISVARPGGEEFAVLIEGAITSEQLLSMAENIRKDISDEPLPNDDEWKNFDSESKNDIRLPHIGERRITVSIGFATTPRMGGSLDTKRSTGDLINKADTALYRAKAGGRNTVRDFSEILIKHGRILEHHPDTGIVTIDIGSLVGVNFGQEFLVYHPDFSGGISFIHTDGRTKKRLGDYPKVPCGRIIVFEVQNEISFCRVTRREEGLRFPAGSVLEAIPAGSISHILPVDTQLGFGIPGLTPGEDLPATVTSIVEKKRKPFVAVFAIADLTGITKKRGQLFVNDALAKLHQAIRENFPATTKIGQTQPSEFAVVMESSGTNADRKMAIAAVNASQQKCTGQVNFRAGVFDTVQTSKDPPETNLDEIDMRKALDLARYAASEEAGDNKTETIYFTPALTARIVSASRTKGEYSKALEDYKRFIECGVKNGYLENQAALTYFTKEERDIDNAIAAARRAVELRPKDSTLHANIGYFLYHKGNLADSYKSYAAAKQANSSFVLSEVYKVSYAKALLDYIKQKPGDVGLISQGREAVKEAIEYAKKHQLKNLQTELEAALTKLA